MDNANTTATSTTKATGGKASARKPAARKAAPRGAAKRAAAKTTNGFSLRQSAEKAVNVYLGVLGASFDRMQENIKSARRENERRMRGLEKRGAKLRTELRGNLNKLDAPEFGKVGRVVEGIRGRVSKLQGQLEDVVGNAKDRLATAKTARKAA